MNYKESKQILKKIKDAKRILISCHWSPDPDSVASSLALYSVIKDLKKDVKVITPSKTPTNVEFLPLFNELQTVDPEVFKYSVFDLIILPDIGNWNMVFGYKKVDVGKGQIVNIDHHPDNRSIGSVNLVDPLASSACEIIYLMLCDLKITVNERLANILLSGIIGDTGAFEWSSAKARTLKIGGELMNLGADKNAIVYEIYRSFTVETLRFWGEILDRMEVDEESHFAWSAIDYELFKRFSNLEKAKSLAASMFARIVKNTDFGIIMVENSPNHLSVSIRERNGFDVSKLAQYLGGGGHKAASAAEIDGVPFEEAVKKVLSAAREYSNEGK